MKQESMNQSQGRKYSPWVGSRWSQQLVLLGKDFKLVIINMSKDLKKPKEFKK